MRPIARQPGYGRGKPGVESDYQSNPGRDTYQQRPTANPRRPCNDRPIDIHEIQKQAILVGGYNDSGAPSIMNGDSGSGGGGQSEEIGFEDIELYFDSVRADDLTGLGSGVISWSVPALNNLNDVQNCIQMHIGQFYFPKIDLGPAYPEFFYYRRAFMEFTDSPVNQAVLAPDSIKFHIEFEVRNINGQSVLFVPIKESFFFQRPLNTISLFQVRFTVPTAGGRLIPIPIPNTRVGAITQMTVPMTLDMSSSAAFGLPGVVPPPGIAVWISNANTGDSATDAQLNDPRGVYVTNIIDSSTVEIGAAGSGAETQTSNVTVSIGKNRFAFSVRFTCVKNRSTNYIKAVHL